MEAASIPWRPLGRILVEQGLLTTEELETALEQQERTGKRLGETIVECGFVSSPELSNALAVQYGIELTTETGFGTGLRTQIQRRHEYERRGARPRLFASPGESAAETQPEEQLDEVSPEAGLLAQLEEQWAKLAAAEALLADREEELAAVRERHDRRRTQAVRLAQRARTRARQPADLPGRDDGDVVRLRQELAHARDRRASLEEALSERQAELAQTHEELGRAREAVTAAQAAIAEQERRLHDFGLEFQRVVDSRGQVERDLAGARAEVDERNRTIEELHGELARARDAVAAAEHGIAEQNARFDDLRAEFERVMHSREELEQALADVAAARDHDRAQAVRLARRARSRTAAPATDVHEQERALDELRGRIEQITDEVRARDDELERLRHEHAHAHEQLDAARQSLSERESELAHARDALAAAEAAAADRDRHLAELHADFERLVHSRGELEQELARLAGERDRRRAQAGRLARRARARATASAEVERLRHEHAETRERLEFELRNAAESRAEFEGALAVSQAVLADRERVLDDLARRFDRRRAQGVRLVGRLRRLRQLDDEQLSQIERLVADVRGCDEEIARLREERDELVRLLEPPPTPEAASHVVFVQLADRYELLERPGPPPARNTSFELPELAHRFVAAQSRRSPLPGDRRPCVVAEPAIADA